MTDYLGSQPSLDDCWRGIILHGKTVATYKFALGKSLLELAPVGKTFIKLEELAEPFSRHITEHLKIEDKQTTSPSSDFLKACRSFNEDRIDKQTLIDITIKLGFKNVINAFHIVNRNEVPKLFFTDARKNSNKGIILTDNLFALNDSFQGQNLPSELESRWRVIEMALKLNFSPNLISISYDTETQQLFNIKYSRISLSACKNILNVYQKGKCFYCSKDISIITGLDNSAEVDHFLPKHLQKYIAISLDGIWNLVLACIPCNRGKGGKLEQLPNSKFIQCLYKRNEFFIKTNPSLRETLIMQAGNTKAKRLQFLRMNYEKASNGKLFNSIGWEPKRSDQCKPVF